MKCNGRLKDFNGPTGREIALQAAQAGILIIRDKIPGSSSGLELDGSEDCTIMEEEMRTEREICTVIGPITTPPKKPSALGLINDADHGKNFIEALERRLRCFEIEHGDRLTLVNDDFEFTWLRRPVPHASKKRKIRGDKQLQVAVVDGQPCFTEDVSFGSTIPEGAEKIEQGPPVLAGDRAYRGDNLPIKSINVDVSSDMAAYHVSMRDEPFSHGCQETSKENVEKRGATGAVVGDNDYWHPQKKQRMFDPPAALSSIATSTMPATVLASKPNGAKSCCPRPMEVEPEEFAAGARSQAAPNIETEI